jgi:hypothetical protein
MSLRWVKLVGLLGSQAKSRIARAKIAVMYVHLPALLWTLVSAEFTCSIFEQTSQTMPESGKTESRRIGVYSLYE